MTPCRYLRLYDHELYAEARVLHPSASIRRRAQILFHEAYRRLDCASIEGVSKVERYDETHRGMGHQS